MRQRDDIWLKELDIADVMPIVDSILEQDDQVREAAKKSYFFLMAVPLRGRG